MELDSEMKLIISRYLIEGNVKIFVERINNRYKELSTLNRWQKKRGEMYANTTKKMCDPSRRSHFGERWF